MRARGRRRTSAPTFRLRQRLLDKGREFATGELRQFRKELPHLPPASGPVPDLLRSPPRHVDCLRAAVLLPRELVADRRAEIHAGQGPVHHGAVPEYPLQPACDAPVRRPSSFFQVHSKYDTYFFTRAQGGDGNFSKRKFGPVRPNGRPAQRQSREDAYASVRLIPYLESLGKSASDFTTAMEDRKISVLRVK